MDTLTGKTQLDLKFSRTKHKSLVTAEYGRRSRASSLGICGGQSDNGTGAFPSTSAIPCQYHSTTAPCTNTTCLSPMLFDIGN